MRPSFMNIHTWWLGCENLTFLNVKMSNANTLSNLERQYHPLEVEPLYETFSLNVQNAKPWKMNLLASSQLDNSIFFFAVHDTIQIYRVPTSSSVMPDDSRYTRPLRTLRSSATNVAINAIKSGYIGTDEVLVSVDDIGRVTVWFLEDLDRPPLVFDNEVSTWGIAIHTHRRLLAVSANSHKITVYNLASSSSKSKKRDKVILRGHGHNIPCIDFSTCGRYIISSSIDCSGRLWDLEAEDGEQICLCTREFGRYQDDWGWSAHFIPRSNMKHLCSQNNTLPKVSEVAEVLARRSLEFKHGFTEEHFGPPSLEFEDGFLEDQDEEDYENEHDEGEEEEEEEEESENEDIENGHAEDGENDNEESADITRVPYFSFFSRESGFEGLTFEVSSEEDIGEDGWVTTSSESSDNNASRSSDRTMEAISSYKIPDLGADNLSSKDVPRPLDSLDDLVLYTTAHDLYLLDPRKSLRDLYKIPRTVSRADRRSQEWLEGLDRLNMVEFISDLNMAIVASQKGTVALVRIVRICIEGQEEQYILNKEAHIPLSHSTPHAPLIGLFVTRDTPHPTQRSSWSWHIHMLCYNGVMTAVKVQRGIGSNPLRVDIVGV